MKKNSGFIKLTQWEHWPAFVYYLPLMPFFVMRALRGGHLIHFILANPGILYSGNGSESKYQTLSLLPEAMRPNSFLVTKAENIESVPAQLKAQKLRYPLIAKPDVGFRGYLVKKINSEAEMIGYLKKVRTAVIIQDFIPYEKELGIFYHRFPGENKGKISSVTIKKFIKVTGDGKSDLSQLIMNDDRAFLYVDIFKEIHKEKMKFIYPEGEKITLSVIGNHSKGTQFINGNHLINDALENFINNVCLQVKGWYYGRLDIKYESMEKLLKAESFKILEINGIISEPTHIYDATHKDATFFKALKEINYHWSIMGQIGKRVHTEQGIPYPKIMPLVKNLLNLRLYTKKLKKLNAEEF